MKKIKIFQNTEDFFHDFIWYARRIGETFNVNMEDESAYYVFTGDKDIDTDKELIGYVQKKDAELLSNEQSDAVSDTTEADSSK